MITHPCNGGLVEVRVWMSNWDPYETMGMIIYACPNPRCPSNAEFHFNRFIDRNKGFCTRHLFHFFRFES